VVHHLARALDDEVLLRLRNLGLLGARLRVVVVARVPRAAVAAVAAVAAAVAAAAVTAI